MDNRYKKTIYACFVAYVVQAICNNLLPLLFLTFHRSYQIPLGKITMLVTFNFLLQLLIDLISVGFVDRLGYRFCMVAAHLLSALGLLLLTILPEVMPDPFVGILLSVITYAVGGGLLEVLVSPVVEACPTDNKEKAMSLLHSFYCWGHVGVVLFSTLFFQLVGISHWKGLALLWALVPMANALAFTRVPIKSLVAEGERGMTILDLIKTKIFWIFVLMMVCSGASEQAVSQWASALAEKELGIQKTLGDLLGPMSFAIFMGTSRAVYGKYGEKIHLEAFMKGSALLCCFSYLLICLSPHPLAALLGCALCGLSVGIMWPGSFSLASKTLSRGGTALFALLALGGDLGCSGGPTLVGMVSSALGDDLKRGILMGLIFPLLLFFLIGVRGRMAGEGSP